MPPLSPQPERRSTIVVIGAGVIGLSCAIKLQDSLKKRCSEAAGGGIQQVALLLVSREWPGSTVVSEVGAPSSSSAAAAEQGQGQGQGQEEECRYSADYASMWAGAHVRPIPATTTQLRREAQWLRETVGEFGRMEAAAATGWSGGGGVTRTMAVELLEAPCDESYSCRRRQDEASFAAETGLSRYRRLSAAEIDNGVGDGDRVSLGFEYETFCIHSPLYCRSLLREFVARGGETLRRELGSEWEAFGVERDVVLVVDASGTGFGDVDYFPTRGQTVLTNMADTTRTVTRQNKDGTWNFIIPRFFGGGTVVGGTKQPGDWSVEPDMRTRNALLAAGRKLRPLARAVSSMGGNGSTPEKEADGEEEEIGVIADIVGRRPTRRGGMRIELEKKLLPGGEATVLHAYGAGGRGYEISWGVANEVCRLAAEFLRKQES